MQWYESTSTIFLDRDAGWWDTPNMELPKLTADDVLEIGRTLYDESGFWTAQDIADIMNRRLELRAEDQERAKRSRIRPNCF